MDVAAGLDQLKALESFGIVLPSPAYLSGAVLFGIIGYVVYRRGRKTARPVLTWAGVTLMVYPYAVPQTWLLWSLGLALCGYVAVKWD